MFGSRPPPNDGIWRYAEKAGFEPHLEDRNYANKEKTIDTGIATLLTKDAYKSDGYKNGKPTQDTFVLVAGDNDYDGFKVEVVFWNHAGRELRDIVSKFIGLDQYLENLRL